MMEKLTYREEQVYKLVVSTSLNTEQIAEKLKIKSPTIRTYLTNIFLKFGVNSRIELIVLHYQNLIQNNYLKQTTKESVNE